MEEKTLKEVCELAGVTRRAVQGYEDATKINIEKIKEMLAEKSK